MNKHLTTGILILTTMIALLGGAAWVARSWAADGEGGTTTSTFRVEGMTCAGCEVGVKVAVKRLAGVAFVDVSYEEGSATVTYDPEQVTPEQIVAAIEKLGYEAEPAEEPGASEGS